MRFCFNTFDHVDRKIDERRSINVGHVTRIYGLHVQRHNGIYSQLGYPICRGASYCHAAIEFMKYWWQVLSHGSIQPQSVQETHRSDATKSLPSFFHEKRTLSSVFLLPDTLHFSSNFPPKWASMTGPLDISVGTSVKLINLLLSSSFADKKNPWKESILGFTFSNFACNYVVNLMQLLKSV